jgi:hypothetical protein
VIDVIDEHGILKDSIAALPKTPLPMVCGVCGGDWIINVLQVFPLCVELMRAQFCPNCGVRAHAVRE